MEHRHRHRPSDQSSSSSPTDGDDRSVAGDEYSDPEGICVDEHGSERGLDRFPRGGDLRVPRIATWRNNLTALSQHRNLYFVGCAHQVFVYQPSGYAQTIGPTPALILTPTMKSPDATGYISAHVPHAMNNMLVGDLGQEEILLLATDSGNVSAYRTEHVFAAIQDKKRSSTQSPEAAGNQVECFFTDWVGESAWGLAIHKYARLIAVSANTSYVTVYAFALVEPSMDSHSDEEASSRRFERKSQSEWLSITGRQYAKLRRWSTQRRRSRNLRLTLYGHATNIPNVSFLNSDLDPEGNWLFSTDIDNKLMAWRLWDRPKPVHTWDFYPSSSRRRHFLDDHQRGWNVLPVDPRVFRAKSSVNLACGGPVHTAAPGDICDLTFLGGRVPDSNRYYRYFPPEQLPGPNAYPFDLGGPPSDESFSGSFASSPAESEIGTEDTSTHPVSDESQDLKESRECDKESATPSRRGSSHSDTATTNSPPVDPTSNQSIARLMQLHASLPLGPNHPIWGIIRDQEEAEGRNREEDNIPTQDSMSEPLNLSDVSEDDLSETESRGDDAQGPLLLEQPSPQTGHQDNIDDASSGIFGDADEPVDRPEAFSQFPIFHFSESHIRLISSPTSRTQSVLFRAPLYQALRESIPQIEACDRFNMIHPIPELGVVVAASQKGRVAMISLTEVQGQGKYFRVDKIAPFDSQEKFGLRPLCPLLGIAVGPVESHLLPVETSNSSSEEDDDDEMPDYPAMSNLHTKDVAQSQSSQPETQEAKSPSQSQPPHSPQPQTPKREAWHGSEYSRRYRLFLMYYDHTVMHYELYYDWPRDIRGREGKVMHDTQQPYSIRP